ncbi:MAG: hypothetical protein HWN66_05545 [Candidatus Helarchaeota archaeon]|nr:hypothetical protein [Candidatus Helarchaeota archaeon]
MGKIEEKVERNIQILINEFKRFPEKFLTEEDIRSFLYSLLLRDFGDIRKCEDSTISIPMHCEVRWYGNSGKLKYRSDIVIIDTSTLRTDYRSFSKYPSKGYGFNKPKAIIEIKLRRQIKESDKSFKEKIINDRIKLNAIRDEIGKEFSTYIIAFDKRKNLRFKTNNTNEHKEYYVYPYQSES